MGPLRLPALAFVALTALSGRAQTPAATAPSCTDGIIVQRPGKFCENVADCQRFCSCACTFDPHKWRDVKDDGSTTCAGMPDTGVGMLAPDSADLHDVPTDLAHIAVPRGTKATQEAVDGLRRLSARLEASSTRRQYNYSVRVGRCYSPHTVDSVPECGIVLKGAYMLARVTEPAQKERWTRSSNPMNSGLTWPGLTPHSGGYGCDLILVDSAGADSFDWRAGVDGPPHSSIEQRLASSLMDEELTNADVGAKRLTYEAWHYEWGPNARGCRAPDCAARYWPLTGKP